MDTLASEFTRARHRRLSDPAIRPLSQERACLSSDELECSWVQGREATASVESHEAAVPPVVQPPPTLARPEALVAVVLWVAHTYAIEHAEATPYLAISSPEKQSGKTRLLECLALLAHDCDGIAITPTASTIFRTLEATPEGTLLLDELDAVFRDHSDKYEEVRAVINAGHRRGATVRRSVPGPKNTWIVKKFPVFGPKALAGIGKLPDTVTDRSIPVLMLKRKRTEPVDAQR